MPSSVRLSVRLSHGSFLTSQKTVEVRIIQFSLYNSPNSLVFAG